MPEQQLRTLTQLLDYIDEAVIGLDVEERITLWNEGATRTYGLNEHEVLGRAAEDVLHPERDAQESERHERRFEALRRKETVSGEFSVRRQDGALIAIEYSARPLFDTDQRLRGYISVQRDVTERRKAERDVRENEARLRALIEASPLGIDIMDVDGSPVFYNPMCIELHGIDIGEASGEGWEQAVHPEDRERIAVSWYAAASAGRPWAATYRFLHRDGKVVWVSGRAAPVRIDGRLVGFVGTLEDITVEREALAKAEQAIRQRDEMLAIVAHDLRNPLSTILLSTHALLAREWPADQRQKRLQAINRSAANMHALIRDLLDMARIEAGRFIVIQSKVEPERLCREALDLVEVLAQARGIGLARRIPPDLPPVLGDPERLAQVLANLLDNALKFTPAGGEVVVRAERIEQGVRIAVEDNGPGIPPEVLPHLFHRFAQADRASHGGTGLGLSIAKAIVEAHGGHIWAETAPGGGASLNFTLPKRYDQPAAI